MEAPMPSFVCPPDLSFNTQDALAWSGGSDAARVFLAFVAAGVPWRPERPRALLRWADKRRVLVDGSRHLVVSKRSSEALL
jgi:hypothetical protein